jgi:hypothetical protein
VSVHRNIKVPHSFLHPLFFTKDDKIELPLPMDATEIENQFMEHPFLFDIAFKQEIEFYRPWEDRNKTVEKLIEKWERNRTVLNKLFENRNRKEARPRMIENISLFFMALFWTNKHPVPALINWEIDVTELPIKPVNCVERLLYIISAPDHYHSNIQLAQLFDELHKQFRKSVYIEKNRPRS